MCLTDGGETRCHVAFRNFSRLGTSAVFIVRFVRASIFFLDRSLFYFQSRFTIPSPRREPADANDEARFGDLSRTFSFRTGVYLFLNDTPSREDRLSKKELIRAMKIKNPFLSYGLSFIYGWYYAFRLSSLSNLTVSSFHKEERSFLYFFFFGALQLKLSQREEPDVQRTTLMYNKTIPFSRSQITSFIPSKL